LPLYQGTGSSGITGGWTSGTTTANYTFNTTSTTSTSWTVNNNWYTDNIWYPLGYLANNEPVRNNCYNEPIRQPTPEEQEERERRAREHRERIRRERQEREAAETRAATLLLSFLSEEQRASYRASERFEVVGSLGGRYRIHPGVVGNIYWLDENGQVGGQLCCHPSDERLPRADIMLAQMLALITDEESFVLLANRYSGNRHPLRERLLSARRRVGV
jgi:hypothetical protein